MRAEQDDAPWLDVQNSGPNTPFLNFFPDYVLKVIGYHQAANLSYAIAGTEATPIPETQASVTYRLTEQILSSRMSEIGARMAGVMRSESALAIG